MKSEKPIPDVEKEKRGEETVRVLEVLRARRETAPKIVERQTLSLETIAEREGVSVEDLEKRLRSRILNFSKRLESAVSYPDEEYTDLIEEIYNLFLMSSDPEAVKDNPWVKNFKSFDDFYRAFCLKANAHAKAYFKQNLQSFNELAVHPSRNLEVPLGRGTLFGQPNEIYEAEGRWVLLPSHFSGSHFYRFAEESVIKEIIDLIERGYRVPDYTHATGSAALKGIASAGALLSAAEAIKKGVKLETGEYVYYVSSHSGHSVSGGKEGLPAVYADNSGPKYGYHFLNWLDEYFITFGIDKSKQEAFLKSAGFSFGEKGEPEILSVDYGSEGTLIGHMVPLSSINTIYFWKKRFKDVQEWANKNCPDAQLASLEAAQILNDLGSIMNIMASQEKISPAEAWKKLLEA